MVQMIVFLLGFLTGAVAAGQGRMERSVSVSITIIDSLTLSPIADAHVSTTLKGDISDLGGKLHLDVDDGTAIWVTHINYHPRQVIYRNAMGAVLQIMMKPSVRMLREISVTDLLSEEAMKRKILDEDVVVGWTDAAAAENSSIINSIVKIAPKPVPSREEQFFESLQGPKGVTFLSSKGGGLIKAIKSLSAPQKKIELKSRQYYRSDPARITPFKVDLKKKDSIAVDSSVVKSR